jgi:23S rRNA (uracil1939-C5)-methyltransferase
MTRGEELDLVIEDFAAEGKSIARPGGFVVFVRDAVPGDTVRARISRVKKQFAEAELLGVTTASPLRTPPRCTHAGTCGGCRWQHVDYAAQLGFKERMVRDALERIGGFRGVGVDPALPSPAIFHYRNKMEFSFGDRWLSQAEITATADEAPADRFALGLHIPGRYDRVLDLEECWLFSERGQPVLDAVRAFSRARALTIYSTLTHNGYLRHLVLREAKRTEEFMVNIVTTDHQPALVRALADDLLARFPFITTIVNNITDRKSLVAVGDREEVLAGDGFLTERIGENTYRISANSFFQTNTLQAERLYDIVRDLARLRPEDLVFDLYSGTGTIALHLAPGARAVVGVEGVEAAVQDARVNAGRNGRTNCMFHAGDLKDRLTRDSAWLTAAGRPDVVVLDPPRSGMHERVVREVSALGASRIVYVSCNPATQARDLAILCAAAPYRITAVRPVDMFPHTMHCESVVALERTAAQ